MRGEKLTRQAAEANACVWAVMYDEVDEGTAMFKVSTSGGDQPLLDDGRLFLSLDADRVLSTIDEILGGRQNIEHFEGAWLDSFSQEHS